MHHPCRKSDNSCWHHCDALHTQAARVRCACRLPSIHAPFLGKPWIRQVQRAGPVRVFEDDTTPADWVRSAEAILADLPEDFTEARVIDLQKVCAALRVSKTGVHLNILAVPDFFWNRSIPPTKIHCTRSQAA